jgi:hypothetical protein
MQNEDLIPANEFCTHYHVEMSFIKALQEHGLLETISEQETTYIQIEQVYELEKIMRLHYDLNVNIEGVDVILHLLKRLEATQEENTRLRNRLNFYAGLHE